MLDTKMEFIYKILEIMENNGKESFEDVIESISKILKGDLKIHISLEKLKGLVYEEGIISDKKFSIPIGTTYFSFILTGVGIEKDLDNKDIEFLRILTLLIKGYLEKEEAKILKNLTLSFISKRNINELFEEILKEIEKIIPYTSANIGLLENDTLQYLSFRGYEKYKADKFMKSFYMRKEEFYTLDTVLRTKKPLLIEDTKDYPSWVFIPETAWIRSFLMIPIIYEDEIIGIISFDSDKAYTFSERDIEKVNSVIPILALSLENTKIYEAIKKELKEKIIIEKSLTSTLYQVLKIASDLVETRDPYTVGHQKKVARISVIIGREMKLPQERLRFIAICALLHDIGKIAIPSEIINKPSFLTPLERSLVNTHSEIGYNILKKINILEKVAPVVYQHHERWNGSGYPLGLKGDEILLEARIIAVADVVEAMTSHRPYRPPLPLESAIKEILDKKGILYDPLVVDAFIHALKNEKIRF